MEYLNVALVSQMFLLSSLSYPRLCLSCKSILLLLPLHPRMSSFFVLVSWRLLRDVHLSVEHELGRAGEERMAVSLFVPIHL